ncbi:cyclin-dependent kinase G-2-like isoform X2 [Cornus florida]|uniref:cyclin-dependent kinase G-2-like isoform X2 n=1 Tax=Cornus florida TaxID=4283 RepID=UPI00289A3404|nr:cyclin-dependent kinase G-2-like isoform X2 [Cornus florida]
MAAGKHGGYRDNDTRDHESDFDVSRRDFAYPKGEYYRIRNGDRGYELNQVRGRGRDLRDRVRVRQRDIKEREVMNGDYHSTSSRSDSGSSGGGGGGPRRCGFSVRTVDREPGELSSESGSDEAIDSRSQVKDNEALKLENGTQSPLESKKRKFSPIVWDRDDNEVSNSSKSRSVPPTTALPPLPPPKSYQLSPNLIPEGHVKISPTKNSKLQSSEHSVKPNEASGLNVSAASESPVGLSFSPPQEQLWSNYHEAGQLEDEDNVTARNISASRWADDANSPADEGEILDDEQRPKRRKLMPLSDSVEKRVRSKSPSPEIAELKRESSEGTRARSSESDEGGLRVRSSSRDDYHDDDLDQNNYMEIDEEHNNSGTSVSDSDTDTEDERGSHDTPEPAVPPQRSVNMLQGCRSVDEFERLNKIDEGTYGVVYRARDKKTGEIVALKKVKMEKEREGFPLTSLREINILLSFHHPSIVDVKEVVVGSNLDSIFMVMEYMEHDLKGLMETMKQPYSQSEVKCLMLQLLEGVKYLHDNWVLHRDLKTSNLLLNNRGELKICDFGLARQYGIPLKPYTHLVVTLWYRAPELLLGGKQYSTAIDMWSLGCIMAELLSKEPLFNGKTEFDQLDKIFRTLGTPNETIWSGFSKLPGVKVNFVKHQLPALGDSGIICCVGNSLLHLLPVHQFYLIRDLTC